MAKVTVVMPTYNDSATVGSAIESILGQKFSDWELIIVDDASTDNTRDLIRVLSEDHRIRVLHSAVNAGSGVARNRAIAEATGEYIAVMDADDISMPERLGDQASAMDADPSLAAVSSQMAEFGDWGGPVESNWPISRPEIARRQRAMKIPIPHPATMFRTADVRSVDGYDETCRRAQDYALFLKLSDRPMLCLPQVLLHYRTQRPLPLEYVIRNGRYAALARQRFDLSKRGVGTEDLPTVPTRSVVTDLNSVKSWMIRNVRERTGR
ncbi:glycosyltransferase family 2 protein [Rhodococcus sp. JS3073]|uniref:glycosyltransferase family 2 protein n=1 Tax=Rhodococcus sp. JS3073 TaxID=3002901 RepID=UPI003FA7C304